MGKSGSYNGAKVGRNSECLGICDYLIPETNSISISTKSPQRNIGVLMISMTIIVILSVILFYLFRKNQHI